jgi:glycine betaine/proline transport system ATP-binding protein
MSLLRFEAVDVLFARGPARTRAQRLAAALADCDAGATRQQVADRHDVLVAVHGASLEVAPGEISVLVGPSGSGKSTLLRTANRLTPVTRGHVWMADGDHEVDVAWCDDAQLRQVRRHRIAMVFQQFALIPTRTVAENVALGLELRGDAAPSRRAVVEEKLALVGLAGWGARDVRELSGGMQQRVGIARALATDADLLLLDEPFSALDALMRRKLQEELRTLQQQVRKTMLFVTHDLEEAARLGDRVSVMHDGRLRQSGTLDELRARPADPQVAEFVAQLRGAP